MPYKQAAPSQSVGWQSPGQPTVPDMWPQQRQAPLVTPPDFQQRMAALDFCRKNMLGNPGGVMGPPPLPQNTMPNSNMVPNYPMMSSFFPSQQMMGFQGAVNDGGATAPRLPNDFPLGPDRSQMSHGFNNKDSMNKFQQMGHMNGSSPNVTSHQSLPAVHRADMQATHGRPNDNHRDVVGLDKVSHEQSDSQSFTFNDGSSKTSQNKQWNSKSIQGILSEPIMNHEENSLSTTTTPPASSTRESLPHTLPNDLQNVLANLLSSNNDLPSDSMSSSDSKLSLPQQTPVTTSTAAAETLPSALPGFNRLLPPMSAGHSTAMSSADQSIADDDKDKPKRRRRKRCGSCGPCKVREDCGECYVCRNKGQVNAICKLRKCLLLRKKAGGSDSGSSTSEVSSTGQFNPLNDNGFGGMDSPGLGSVGMSLPAMSSSGISSTGMGQLLKQPPVSDSSGQPANNTDPARQQMFGNNSSSTQAHANMQNIPHQPSTATVPHYFNKAQQNSMNTLPGAQANVMSNHMMYRTQAKPSVKAEITNSLKQDQPPKHSTDTNNRLSSAGQPNKVHSRWQGASNVQAPWTIQNGKDMQSRPGGTGFSRPIKQAATTPHRSTTNGQLNDLYSTFKDDMQKMNERTYGRANGVKVCKLMAKLLKLNITADEYKSSQPPKPPPNAWAQFMPDSKVQDGQPISRPDSITEQTAEDSPTDSAQFAEVMREPAPREVVTQRLSDPDALNSQGTTSDVEADPMGDSVQSMDTQAVDSGFSSSSPADRQSPSPKVRFALPSTDGEETRMEGSQTMQAQVTSNNTIENSSTQAPGSDAVGSANQMFPYAQRHSTLPVAISNQPQEKSFPASATAPPPISGSQEESADCALDLSANSTSFPRMPDMQPQCDAISSQQPLIHAVSSASQPPSQPQTTPCLPALSSVHQLGPAQQSMESLISSLAVQMTGDSTGSMQETKAEAELDQDAAHLIKHNKIAEPPKCGCVNRPYDENTEGPYYVHLGAANSIKAIRELVEERSGYAGDSIRIEKIRFTTKEGRTSLGCPAAKWILRRSGADEKVLVVTKHRPGHYCQTAWLIIAIVVWEGVPGPAANHMYDYLTRTLPVYGYETERRCGTNQPRSCACQGWDMNRKGASFSFGCSWSVYYNGCKFARSHVPRKFKLRDQSFEGVMESKFQALGQHLSPLYKEMAPMSYGAQVRYETKASDCRIGFRTGRPFSGCTATVDFCAHQHRDTHNMNNGCTVVVTLTKHRGLSKPADEQLHTLPMYCLENTDEHGSTEGIHQRVANGHIEILNAFSQEQRRRSQPYKKRKKGTETYQSPKVKMALMESIRDKIIQDSKEPSRAKQETSMQKPMVPLPQDRETAKQDLFNSQAQLAHGSQQLLASNQQKHHSGHMTTNQPPNSAIAPSTDQPTGSSQMMNAYRLPSPFSNMNGQQTQPFYRQGMLPPSSDSTPQQMMEQRVRQHIINAQLQAQQNPQQSLPQQLPQPLPQQLPQQLPQPAPKQEMPTPSAPTAAVEPVDSGVAAEKVSDLAGEVEIDEQDERLNPPKPRPPSPEYDDVDGKEVHEDNTHLFRDPDVGGVALALSHGAVLFEVAKRELHATTALRQPDRYNPTRISLVFYQHKRLNYKNHGMQEYKKAEEERQKARRAARAAGIEYIPKGLKYKQKRMQDAALRKNRLTTNNEIPMTKFTGIRKKPGRKVGWKQRKQLRFAAYQYMWPRAVNHAKALTTTTTVTNWVKGKCIITGPYQKWISLHTPALSSSGAALPTTSLTSMHNNRPVAQLLATSITTTSIVNAVQPTPSVQATKAVAFNTNPSTVSSSSREVIACPTPQTNCLSSQNMTCNNTDSSLKLLLEGDVTPQLPTMGNLPPQLQTMRNLPPQLPTMKNLPPQLPTMRNEVILPTNGPSISAPHSFKAINNMAPTFPSTTATIHKPLQQPNYPTQ